MSTYAINRVIVPCVNSIAVSVDCINSGLWFKKFKAQPFNIGAGIQSAPVWSDFTMDTGWVGLAYAEQWAMTNVTFPVTYSVLSGSLPTGLSIASSGNATGTISGTPTTAGSYAFTLRATNVEGTADHSFTIDVNPVPVGGFIL